jgi:phage terminase large subunit-like protein
MAARTGRVALVAPTLHDAREVMVEGPSGVASLPNRTPPRYEPSRRRLRWSNGAVGYVFSAEDPDSLRGPQFAAAWADEFCAWSHPAATLANLRLGLRIGAAAPLAVTSTPRPLPALRRLLAEPGTVRSDAATTANAGNLGAGFLDGLLATYGGTRLAAQELEGLLVESEGALWRAEDLARARVETGPERFDDVVVAVDPPAGMDGAACGIVAAGTRNGLAYVLADRTVRGLSPAGWAGRVAATVEAWDAHAVVAEANQGGEMVRTVLKAAGVSVPVRLVHARQGKRARAEPVAALYEQGRVRHVGEMRALEEALMAMGDDGGDDAPGGRDRADALVWALTDLVLEAWEGPRLTVL